ncbi:MAG: ribosome recycling factor [Alphaproteobacteria bacterium]|nr:ribosome recycling factor [Alphaproteobacteria bacterium]
MTEAELMKDLRRRMDGALDVLRKEFGGLRTGRASASLLEPVVVEAYGNTVPLNQVASVNVPEPRMITVQVWDRGLAKSVDKAIRESGLGLNPQTEGQTIRVPIPELNQERRKELSKVAGKYAEEARIAVRNVRRDGVEESRKLEKNGDLSQDQQRKLQGDIQHLTDDHVKKIDDTLAQKEKEILQV